MKSGRDRRSIHDTGSSIPISDPEYPTWYRPSLDGSSKVDERQPLCGPVSQAQDRAVLHATSEFLAAPASHQACAGDQRTCVGTFLDLIGNPALVASAASAVAATRQPREARVLQPNVQGIQAKVESCRLAAC